MFFLVDKRRLTMINPTISNKFSHFLGKIIVLLIIIELGNGFKNGFGSRNWDRCLEKK